jgi:glycosyltransferase involved in cell wall biosynthesis
MTEPIISVMMITYNHAPYITQAIEGVLAQKTNFPFELVIGEDCSTDGTREIVFQFQDRYPDTIRVISSEKNVGPKQNIYRTMKACRGKYIAHCEGDDYWHHLHKLQKQADYLENHPECGLVFSRYAVNHMESKVLIRDFFEHRKWRIPQNPAMWDILDFFKGAMILTCTVMTRRTLSEQVIESDPYLHQSEHFLMGDIQHWVEIAAMAGVHYIPEALATYNITAESATRSEDVRKILRFSVSSAELFKYLCKKYNAPSSIREKHEAAWRDASLRLAFHSRSADLADEVRRTNGQFTLKEWVRYYGAKHVMVHYVYRLAVLFLGLFRKEHDQWR